MGQVFVRWITRVPPHALIQPAEKRREYDAAEPADCPCDRHCPEVSWLFHLDVREYGPHAGAGTYHDEKDRIIRHQCAAEYQCTKDSERDMVPCDHDGILRFFPLVCFPIVVYLFVCACVHRCDAWTIPMLGFAHYNVFLLTFLFC